MSRKVDAWSMAPRESAHPWAAKGLSGYDRMVGLTLTVSLDCAREAVPGQLDAAIEHAMRGVMNGPDRSGFLRSIARLKARGLIFEHEGLIYVLYSETMWRKHRSLSEQYAAKQPILKLVRKRASDAPPADRENHARSDPGLIQVGSKTESTSRNHSTHTSHREREERENTTCSTAAPPAAAPPPPTVDPVTETRPTLAKAARRRAPQPLDAPRERAVALFNELWSPTRGQGATWAPRGTDFGLLTAMVRCYLHPDGTLNESLYRLSVRAFLREESWRNYGGWKPQKFMVHHLGGLTQAQPTGTESAYAGF